MAEEVIKAINFVDVDCTSSEDRHVVVRFTDMKEPIMNMVRDVDEDRDKYGYMIGSEIKQKYESITFNSANIEVIYHDDKNVFAVEGEECSMKKFRVTRDADYVIGHLRYGHLEGVIEAESLEEAKKMIEERHYDDCLKLVLDDWSVDDIDYGSNPFEYEEIG